ncbi:polymer-forming cytoskeletal protein [Paraferrimonas sp. SM1919]|uniref:bactofilin family protein n=1 Tax=Paraferrimonas sp. SM1919 TaxID=2662263 RepID=UPI0013D4FF1D|nr:polymer-forming cytoskeletal protein [Paraferrimonas sp. SM1919]
MFSKKKSTQLTFIAPGCHINGKMDLHGEALIGGHVEGELNSSANIEIDQQGLFDGKLQCQDVKVSGHFKGSLSCSRLVILNHGTVEGEVCCEHMEIYDGGQFIGRRVKEPQALLEHTLKKSDDKKKATEEPKLKSA